MAQQQNSPRLHERFVNVCRTSRKSIHTQYDYWRYVVRFIKFHVIKSELELTEQPEKKFAQFITSLARQDVAASTQNVAWNAILFLYRDVLKMKLGEIPDCQRATRPARLPDVPATHDETMRIVEAVPGLNGLALRLIYGAGTRIKETLRLRLKDLDFANGTILIRSGKGDRDGIVPLPHKLEPELRDLGAQREMQHGQDLRNGLGWVWLPNQLGRKYPKTHYDTQWQYLFASDKISTDPISGMKGRHHLSPETLQNAMRTARTALGIKRRIVPHSLRHAAARYAERHGTPVSEIQRWLRHKNVETTLRYLGQGTGGKPKIVGPLD